jgi:glutamine cyclotransferase
MHRLVCVLLLAQFAPQTAPQRYRVKVVRSFPHDPGAFTQGLEYRDGFLYEGTGLKGQSTLRKVKLETGAVLQSKPLESQYFGEGITVFPDRILQLTWQAEQGFIYDRQTFERKGQFRYSGEGWGLASDGKQIYMSDGSSQIRVWDAATLKELRRITVRSAGRPIDNLNELEWVEGEIYANVWQTDYILRISPADGRVTGIIDCTGLLDQGQGQADVLNGIAYDKATRRLFLTGKLWPRLYQVELARVP